MKTHKTIFFASYVLNLFLIAALIDFVLFNVKTLTSTSGPKSIFPVILVQNINGKLQGLNLFSKDVFLDSRKLSPAEAKDNKISLVDIYRIPLLVEWDNKSYPFPSDFAKEAPSIISIEEIPKCTLCLKAPEQWLIRKGTYKINEMLVIPANTKLVIESGTRLEFTDQSGIFSRSPILARNVLFKGNKWKGITILNQSREKSIFDDVVVEGGTGFEIFGMKYTGSVNFILGEIHLTNFVFQNSLAEDALNIKWVHGRISKAQFINSFSDALDIDWSDVKIVDLEISDSKNDCLDLSGGRIFLEKAKLSRCGDKGISNGEDNQLFANGVIISQSKTSIANKDGADFEIKNAIISNSELAFHQYHQKTFYNEPSGLANENVQFNNVMTAFKIEAGKVKGHDSL